MPDISDKVVIYLLLNVNCVTWNLEMVEKIKINDYGDCVYSEDAVIELIYQNPELDISKIFTEVDQYNSALEELDIDLPKLSALETKTEDLQLFDKNNILQRR